jgi:hypothetical protein
MRHRTSLSFAFTALATVAAAQQPAQPPLIRCGLHDAIEILCGTRSPEDLELTPDGKFLIVPQFVNGRGGTGAGLVLFDIARKTFNPIAIHDEPQKTWGDPSCPGPPASGLIPHGISLAKRTGSKNLQLDVVNHGGRQSMEIYELKRAGANWELAWHGCVVSKDEFNDVAALPDGSFVATHPLALRKPGYTSNLFSGEPSGYVIRWTPGKGEEELPGTRMGYPNGVLVSADGHTMYVNAWTERGVRKYDLNTGKQTGAIKLDFMPDNITWEKDGKILAAGVQGTRGDCPAGSGYSCIQGFGVAEIDPAGMKSRTIVDWQGTASPIGGVSVALRVGDSIYLGAFQGDRIVKMDYQN